MGKFNFDKSKTIRKEKNWGKDSLRYELHKQAQASLGAGASLRTAVKLPPGENLNEWLAVHLVDLFNRVNLIFGAVTDFCTPEACPKMSAGKQYEFMWKDNKDYPKPTAMPASQYVHLLMAWIEDQINDEAIFPSDPDVAFPKNFKDVCKNIFRRMFRVFAHVYYSHWEQLVEMGAEAPLNALFKHFIFFVQEFNLIDKRELQPMEALIEKFSKLNPKV